MRALIIGEDEKGVAEHLIQHAEANAISIDRLKQMIAGKERPIGDDPKHVAHLTNGYRVVFSVEDQKFGRCRHVSISVSGDGRFPHPAAVNMILELFEFKFRVPGNDRVRGGATGGIGGRGYHLWVEKEPEAINVLESYER